MYKKFKNYLVKSTYKETLFVLSSNTIIYMPRNLILLLKQKWFDPTEKYVNTYRTHRKICENLNDDFLIHSEKCTDHSNQNTYIDLSGVFLLV